MAYSVFSKKIRHLLYIDALDRLGSLGYDYICICLIAAVREHALGRSNHLDVFGMSGAFPELWQFKPDGMDEDRAWWPVNDDGLAKRKEVLQKCIELTSVTNKTKKQKSNEKTGI